MVRKWNPAQGCLFLSCFGPSLPHPDSTERETGIHVPLRYVSPMAGGRGMVSRRRYVEGCVKGWSKIAGSGSLWHTCRPSTWHRLRRLTIYDLWKQESKRSNLRIICLLLLSSCFHQIITGEECWRMSCAVSEGESKTNRVETDTAWTWHPILASRNSRLHKTQPSDEGGERLKRGWVLMSWVSIRLRDLDWQQHPREGQRKVEAIGWNQGTLSKPQESII